MELVCDLGTCDYDRTLHKFIFAMAVPRARAGSGAGQRGDTAITVRKDLVMDEGTGLVAERKTVVAGVPTADSESGGGVATEEQLRPMRPVRWYTEYRR